ncbi:MAG: sel1 repeat family protein [Candidatus Melainabacteria bacterium]|nr:sel1 repeat family protein [Candidatus Melainabacteria bacterium]
MTESFMKCIYDGYAAREAGDPKEAFECFAKAAEFEPNSPIAAFELGCFFEEGEIVPQDLEKAFALYSKAADGCVVNAQLRLAEWYEKGFHVNKNSRLAKHWRRRVNEQEWKEKNKVQPLTLAESIRRKIAESQSGKKP